MSSPVTPIRPAGAQQPRGKAERLARVFDLEVHPLYTRRFEQLLLRPLIPPPGARVLEAGCHTGGLTGELLRRFDGNSHIVAVDGQPALLALAREHIGRDPPGLRVFFRPHNPNEALAFADDHFDVTIANWSAVDLADPAALIADLVRVTKPGAQVLFATALRGTWTEFLDVMREVLMRRRAKDALAALEQYERGLPDAEALASLLESAGGGDVQVELDRWELLFRSAREFFYAPLVEHGPLRRWKEIAGRGDVMQAIFQEISTTIDTYFSGRPFSVSVVGGCFAGRKIDRQATGQSPG